MSDRADELQGLRPTRQRMAVLASVERLGVFASAQAVHEDLDRAGEHVGLSTVYRSLHALAERGALDMIRARDGELLYRKCVEAAHHHLVCRRCGTAVEIPSRAVVGSLHRLARRAGFAEAEVALEVFGVCSACMEHPE